MSAYETREQWGATGDPGGRRVGKQSELLIHHSWKPHVPASATVSEEREAVRAIERYHEENNGWSDIAYPFLIFQSGRAYEGRGWFRSGAHTAGRNDKPAFCFVINGDDYVPTDAAWETGRQIIAEGIQVGALTSDYTLSGHADYANYKSCPGDKTYPVIGEHLSPTLIVAASDNQIEEADMPLSEDDIQDIAKAVWVFDLPNARVENKLPAWRWLARVVRSHKTDVDALADAIVSRLPEGADAQAVAQAVRDELAEALGD